MTRLTLLIVLALPILLSPVNVNAQAPSATEPPSDQPIEKYCADPTRQGTDVCLALARGECKGFTVGLCEQRDEVHLPRWLSGIIGDPTVQKATAGVIIAVLAVLLATLRVRFNALAARLGDPFFKRPNDRNFETLGVNVVLIGEGGSGKTSIIRGLSGSRAADPALPTDSYAAYNVVHEVDVKKEGQPPVRRIVRMYIEDYEGQKLKTRVLDPRLKIRERAVPSTIVIVVVDLFAVRARTAPAIIPQTTWDQARVDWNCEQYPEAMLDVLSGISTVCRHVCLFINKSDLILPFSRTTKARILEAYAPLRTRLSGRFRHVNYHEVVGAATCGLGVVGYDDVRKVPETLLELILAAAVPVDMKKLKDGAS